MVTTFGRVSSPGDVELSLAFDPSGTEIWIAGHLRGAIEGSGSPVIASSVTAFALRMKADLSQAIGRHVEPGQAQGLGGLALASGAEGRRAALAGSYVGPGIFGLPDTGASLPDMFVVELGF